jgi:hypothetical protein
MDRCPIASVHPFLLSYTLGTHIANQVQICFLNALSVQIMSMVFIGSAIRGLQHAILGQKPPSDSVVDAALIYFQMGLKRCRRISCLLLEKNELIIPLLGGKTSHPMAGLALMVLGWLNAALK